MKVDFPISHGNLGALCWTGCNCSFGKCNHELYPLACPTKGWVRKLRVSLRSCPFPLLDLAKDHRNLFPLHPQPVTQLVDKSEYGEPPWAPWRTGALFEIEKTLGWGTQALAIPSRELKLQSQAAAFQFHCARLSTKGDRTTHGAATWKPLESISQAIWICCICWICWIWHGRHLFCFLHGLEKASPIVHGVHSFSQTLSKPNQMSCAGTCISQPSRDVLSGSLKSARCIHKWKIWTVANLGNSSNQSAPNHPAVKKPRCQQSRWARSTYQRTTESDVPQSKSNCWMGATLPFAQSSLWQPPEPHLIEHVGGIQFDATVTFMEKSKAAAVSLFQVASKECKQGCSPSQCIPRQVWTYSMQLWPPHLPSGDHSRW